MLQEFEIGVLVQQYFCAARLKVDMNLGSRALPLAVKDHTFAIFAVSDPLAQFYAELIGGAKR